MRRLISFIRFESLEVSLLITYTTAILTEWSTIDVFVSNELQISTARIIGKNSRTEMWYSSQLVSKEPKNHLVPNTQPKPTLLASVNKCRGFEVNDSPDGKKALPLKCSIKRNQAARSARASLSRLR